MKFSLRIITMVALVTILVAIFFGNPNFMVKPASAVSPLPSAVSPLPSAVSPLRTALHVTVQNTTTSSQSPLPGHQGDQLAMVLPPRGDGKLWVGTVTWTASKPVDLVVLHAYNHVLADVAHGVPFTAKPVGWGVGLSTVAITMIAAPPNPVPSGTAPFAGSAIAFYTLGGAKPKPFTVTYTLDATANTHLP